jgi:hypothetical protein
MNMMRMLAGRDYDPWRALRSGVLQRGHDTAEAPVASKRYVLHQLVQVDKHRMISIAEFVPLCSGSSPRHRRARLTNNNSRGRRRRLTGTGVKQVRVDRDEFDAATAIHQALD